MVVPQKTEWWTHVPKFTATYLSGLKPKAKRYVVTEGNGFYIEVMPTGEKSFRYRYRLNGKREKVTIGSYPSMTLKVAHIRHATMLEKVNLGESPAHSKREARLQAAAGLDPQDTFGYLAEKWIEQVLKPTNKNSRQDEIYVRRDIIPKIGSKLPALGRLWITPTARQLSSSCAAMQEIELR